jgi:hypothetical protein
MGQTAFTLYSPTLYIAANSSGCVNPRSPRVHSHVT